jgi:hypothetical protein
MVVNAQYTPMKISDTGKEMEFGQQSCSDFNFQRYNSFIGNGYIEVNK